MQDFEDYFSIYQKSRIYKCDLNSGRHIDGKIKLRASRAVQ